jgi:hypothetical protein
MKKIILISSALLLYIISIGQSFKSGPLNADSLATGNYKDVFNSFFQLSLQRFTSTDRGLKFTSNPYAIMSRADTGLLNSEDYYKFRRLRWLNFSFSAKLDSAYRFNGFSSGINYAIINKRDETVSTIFLHNVTKDSTLQDFMALNLDLEGFISSYANNISFQDTLRDQKNAFTKGEIVFSKIHPTLRKKIIALAKEKKYKNLTRLINAAPDFNFKKTTDQIFDEVKANFNNRLLWTVGASDTTYKDAFMFSNIVLNTELVKGIDKMRTKDVELNIKALYQFVDDSVKTGRDLKRQVFSFEPGINMVFKTKNLKSFLEFKIGGGYYYTASALYKNEERSRLTLNGTFRLRVINDIWIPLEIKYDTKTGNVFGFLNVRANFTALKGILQ